MPEKEPNFEPEKKDNEVDEDNTGLEEPEIEPKSTLEIVRHGRKLIKPINDRIKQLKVEFKGLLFQYVDAPLSELDKMYEAMKQNKTEQKSLAQERERIEEETKQKIRDRSGK